jgi:hypothetical protein
MMDYILNGIVMGISLGVMLGITYKVLTQKGE